DKERVPVEVVQRVLDEVGTDAQRVEQAVFDTLYEERKRLETEPDGPSKSEQLAFYERMHTRSLRMDVQSQRKALKQITHRFVQEVTGHFDPRVYALSTRLVPVGLNLLLNALSPIKLVQSIPLGMSDLEEQFEVSGHVQRVKSLAQKATLVMVPTHSSNLDSILMGYAIWRMGLPPHLYGAGLNLFSNKLIGFFMHNLGAYRVDRRKKAKIYKDVLKAYAGCSMELGYHNLFFPGGTRSRSGRVEQGLKLGLLGMGLDAYVRNLIEKKVRPDIFVVPCTINYELVLEAETLIADYLKEAGKARYIIEDDEFSKPKVILDFTKKLFSLQSKIHVVLGEPLDVFGNRVDDDGVSRDFRDRPIDRTRYVIKNGIVQLDAQRDGEYTRELAHAIVQSYRKHTMLKTTNVLCHVVFRWLQEKSQGMDLYRLLRTGGAEESIPIPEAYGRIDKVREALRRLADRERVRLDLPLREFETPTLVHYALAHLSSYHRRAAIERRGDRLFHEDRNLIYFYQNRLDGHVAELQAELS
ncbi:MAG TPA: 1-acyl-sn-glycerol-3-phosphate acyltransferase, partial [Polyangiaceae bacterium]|nr:1-acyl-sn-glycerol-3-phosphate acyltransferase [Polyangiaceae bacterium]